ncbi:putative tartrate transporter [compost metagenome]
MTSPTGIRQPVDAASQAYIEPSSIESGQIIAKLSRHLLWFLFLLFVVSFLDRINIGFAALTMMKDLGLSSTQFGLATTLFYLAYIAFGVPSNVVLARVGARRWIATIMIAWGMASTATLFATNATTLNWLRVLVGITEAGFLPGMLLYLTFWFPAAYRARANALFMIAMPVTAAFGSAISGVILGLDGMYGLKGWQWLFLLEGLPASVLGLIVYFYLNDTPAQARWLTPDEKCTLARMLAAEHRQERVSRAPGERPLSLWSELTSATVLKFSLAYFCLVNSLAMVAVWTPLIVKGFAGGASNTTIGLLAAIPQVCTVIGMIWWGRRSDRAQERRWHTVVPMLCAAAGWLLTAWSSQPATQLLGVCLASTGAYTAMSIFWTTPDHALSFGARALGIAVINATGNIGSALNPLVVGWLKDTTHTFTTGLLYAAVLLVAGCAVFLVLPIPPAQKAAT